MHSNILHRYAFFSARFLLLLLLFCFFLSAWIVTTIHNFIDIYHVLMINHLMRSNFISCLFGLYSLSFKLVNFHLPDLSCSYPLWCFVSWSLMNLAEDGWTIYLDNKVKFCVAGYFACIHNFVMSLNDAFIH